MIEHGSTPAGRWLRERRVGIALWIAVLEAILVAVEDSVSRWTIVVIAAPLIALYLWAGRSMRSDVGRNVTWIAAASQCFAVVAVILAFVIGWLAFLVAAMFAVVALVFLFSDRR